MLRLSVRGHRLMCTLEGLWILLLPLAVFLPAVARPLLLRLRMWAALRLLRWRCAWRPPPCALWPLPRLASQARARAQARAQARPLCQQLQLLRQRLYPRRRPLCLSLALASLLLVVVVPAPSPTRCWTSATTPMQMRMQMQMRMLCPWMLVLALTGARTSPTAPALIRALTRATRPLTWTWTHRKPGRPQACRCPFPPRLAHSSISTARRSGRGRRWHGPRRALPPRLRRCRPRSPLAPLLLQRLVRGSVWR